MSRITARAPVRIDFGGGWTDVPPYPEEQGGYVTSVAITRYVTATAEPDPRAHPDGDEPAIISAARRVVPSLRAHIALHSDVPIGSGLGGSSAASVALLAALTAADGRKLVGTTLAETSRRFEVHELGIAGGWQDHYAAALGGALAMEFTRTNRVVRLPLAEHAAQELESSMLLYFTGASRLSADTIDAVKAGYLRHDPGTRAALRDMERLARAMAEPLVTGDVAHLGSLVGEHWLHQRALHSAITTPLLDTMITTALRAGAFGAKALGASGGGCMIVLAPVERVPAIAALLDPLATRLSFAVDRIGCAVRST
ncbi:MAG: hypothetical protein MUF00_09325 [Gemmatimonadaceae bacterium]|jgi:D-glycero-alpha-D-manno-heptose-7-phosphate kinase|nr:hypothetical protein [Gemmatimonadaceae bacterium]